MQTIFCLFSFVMSLINIMSLGGIAETGKNLYVVEVDKDIFIFDAGLKYPSSDFYGVDIVLPDVTYLVSNSSRIKGIFLSHAHDDHIGSLPYILKYSNIDVYAAPFTIDVVKVLLQENEINPDGCRLYSVDFNEELRFGPNTLRFIQASHGIPGASIICLKTKDGNILYTGNYNFEQNDSKYYHTDIASLVKIREEGVLALMQESISTTMNIDRNLTNEFISRLGREINISKGRVIISLFSTNLERIEQVIKTAISHGRKVSIIGKKTQRIVNIALQQKLIDVDEDKLVNLKFITDYNKNNDKDLVCLVCGERHEPYFMLQRMYRGYDRLVHLEKEDTIIILTRPHVGLEQMATKTLDMIFHRTDNVVVFPGNLLLSASSSEMEAKMMLDITRPKYLIPVIGEIRQQYNVLNLAKKVNFPSDKVIISELGEVHRFYNGEYLGVIEKKNFNDILIEGKGLTDVNDHILKERLTLGSQGFVMFVALIDAKKREIKTDEQVIYRGLNLSDENIERIKAIFREVTEEEFKGKYINWVTYKQHIKEEIAKYLYSSMKVSPLVVAQIASAE